MIMKLKSFKYFVYKYLIINCLLIFDNSLFGNNLHCKKSGVDSEGSGFYLNHFAFNLHSLRKFFTLY